MKSIGKNFVISLFLFSLSLPVSVSAQTFGGHSNPPDIATRSVGAITQTSAVLNGYANPAGVFINAWFELGSDLTLGGRVGQHFIDGNAAARVYSTTLTGLQPGTAYYYRAVGQNSNGATAGEIVSFTTPGGSIGVRPTVSTNSASVGAGTLTFSGAVNPQGSAALAWFEYGLTPSLGAKTPNQSVGSGQSAAAFSASISNVAPGATYYYRASAQNSSGTAEGVILNISIPSSASNAGFAPAAVIFSGANSFVFTRPATLVSQNGALLNGIVNPNGVSTTAWFEWGETPNLGNSTTVQPVGSGGLTNYSFALLNLQPAATYFYRAAGQNDIQGARRDQVLSFTTGGEARPLLVAASSAATPPAGRVRIAAVSPSSVRITPSVDKTEPSAGDEITLTVRYENASTATLRDAVVRVTLSPAVSFVSANVIPRLQSGNELEFSAGDIPVEGKGEITIRVRVRDSLAKDEAIVFSVRLTWRDPSGSAQESTGFLALSAGAGSAGGFASLISGGITGILTIFIHFLILAALVYLIVLKLREEREKEQRA